MKPTSVRPSSRNATSARATRPRAQLLLDGALLDAEFASLHWNPGPSGTKGLGWLTAGRLITALASIVRVRWDWALVGGRWRAVNPAEIADLADAEYGRKGYFEATASAGAYRVRVIKLRLMVFMPISAMSPFVDGLAARMSRFTRQLKKFVALDVAALRVPGLEGPDCPLRLHSDAIVDIATKTSFNLPVDAPLPVEQFFDAKLPHRVERNRSGDVVVVSWLDGLGRRALAGALRRRAAWLRKALGEWKYPITRPEARLYLTRSSLESATALVRAMVRDEPGLAWPGSLEGQGASRFALHTRRASGGDRLHHLSLLPCSPRPRNQSTLDLMWHKRGVTLRHTPAAGAELMRRLAHLKSCVGKVRSDPSIAQVLATTSATLPDAPKTSASPAIERW